MACVLRAEDASRIRPVCGDTFAAKLVDDELRAKVRAAADTGNASASSVARHRLIDDALRRLLLSQPQRRVIVLGAGLDTRAFRLAGGRWWEFDDADVLTFKEQRLPAASAPNPLVRASVEPVDDPVPYPFARLAGNDDVAVVMEGLSMYQAPAALAATAEAIRSHLPHATLICDLMTPAFRRRFSPSLRDRSESAVAADPADPIRVLETAGFRPIASESIVGRARLEGTVRVPGWLLATFLRELRDGYRVWTFAVR
jgi:methyltransferase (TIGR00027 family)